MFKRIFDLSAALLALFFLWPVLVLLAIVIRLNLGSPVFFRQARPGLKGRPFQILKFRTMTDERNELGELFPDSVRLTSLGRFLRATSLDELPELYNILRGEMSFVGPRPLKVEYLPLYNERQALRHEVRPGLTGWAQVNGRNTIGWQDRLEMDAWYVDNHSFVLDMKILYITISKVVRREGITADNCATMTPFEGNDPNP